ncbi:flavin-containing monooxygenase [Sphingomonas sp. Leaf25]|uniref:flavin-containing monooxygenase n=1 Tax=Sphingomonas sp. Leaf25 TaxID=1735692 RepID=UPI0006F99687|nr:NAD(P)/FAD-dependent oxidoreductase [Sphingomonas sp. Leaf25]KQM98186.1 FAD-containing monooxygenase EthA [Sphingomonas sp. Leaf25]
MPDEFDVIVVGAGLSGIGAAHHLQRLCPDRSFAVLEGRGALGGTWDLFRYPGVRSDSDMFTLGYGFRPWAEEKAIADGATIRDYIADTARESGIDSHIRYHHRMVHAAWSSADARWTLTIERTDTGGTTTLSCGFLYLCTGYYDYAQGYRPTFAGEGDFAGRIVHPQFWPADLDYTGKQVVVIGSGATAVTLVPAMTDRAAKVTMLQRSPSYVLTTPARDPLLGVLRRVLPWRAAYGIARWLRIGISQYFYVRSRRKPEAVRRWLLKQVHAALPPGYDVAKHFSPSYDPWDQRLCIVPDGDLFRVIREGHAEVATGHVDRFTATGIRLTDGTHLPADVVVTATGLELQLFGAATLSIDGRPVDPSKAMNYKGMMFSDLPNLAYAFGYTNASWTLRADLTAAYVCRLLNTMKARGVVQATPRIADTDLTEEPLLDFTSSYVKRGIDRLPRQGSKAPWRVRQSYLRDRITMRFGDVTEQMEFR